jgi:hypothetical protein
VVLGASALMLMLGLGWSVRYLDLFYHLNLAAARNQSDWVFVDTWKQKNTIDARYPDAAPFIAALRRQAIAIPVPNPVAAHRTWERYSDTR